MADIVKLDDVGLAGAVGLAAAAIGTGRVVILPADTVYGLSAAVFQLGEINNLEVGEPAKPWPEPIERLYAMKGRSPDKPAIVLARDWQYAQYLCDPPLARIEAFCRACPTPVTAVVEARENWGPPLTNDKGGIAVRVPRRGVTATVLRFCKYIYSVSANYPGEKPPQMLSDVPALIFAQSSLALDGGPTVTGRSSFIVDFSVDPPQPLRGGDAVQNALERYWK